MTQARPTPLPSPTDLIARGTAIIGLAGIGLVHLLDSIDTYHETRYVFWLYVAVMAASIVVSGALLVRSDPRIWLLVGLVAVAPLAGFILSRTSGLPGSTDDIGNWSDPLGLASLWIETLVLALAAFAYQNARAPRAAPREPLEHLERAATTS